MEGTDMKKTLLFTIIITLILCTSCTEKKTPDPIQSNQIILNEIGLTGSIHDSQTSWEFLELKDFDLWALYIKKDRRPRFTHYQNFQCQRERNDEK